MPKKHQNTKSEVDDNNPPDEEGASPAPAATGGRIDNTTGGYSRDPGRGTGAHAKQRGTPVKKTEAGPTGGPTTRVDNTTGAPIGGGHESGSGGS